MRFIEFPSLSGIFPLLCWFPEVEPETAALGQVGRPSEHLVGGGWSGIVKSPLDMVPPSWGPPELGPGRQSSSGEPRCRFPARWLPAPKAAWGAGWVPVSITLLPTLHLCPLYGALCPCPPCRGPPVPHKKVWPNLRCREVPSVGLPQRRELGQARGLFLQNGSNR